MYYCSVKLRNLKAESTNTAPVSLPRQHHDEGLDSDGSLRSDELMLTPGVGGGAPVTGIADGNLRIARRRMVEVPSY